MNKKNLFKIFITILCLYSFTFGYSEYIQTTTYNREMNLETKDWTIFFYIAADNSLSEAALIDIKKIRLGSHSKSHILISHHTKRSDKKTSERLIVENKKIIVDAVLPAMDSGSPKTFLQELEWAYKFSSKKLMVIMWDHGGGILNKSFMHGIRGICSDETTGNRLTDLDLKNCFEIASIKTGRKPDIITLDACLMGSTEIAYALQNCANFLIASEDLLPGNAFDYTELIGMLEYDRPNPISYAKTFIKVYQQSFNYLYEKYAIAAIDLSKIAEVSKNISLSAQALKAISQNNKQASTIIEYTLKETLKFDDIDYIDLGDFFSNLYKNIPEMDAHVETKKILENLSYQISKSLSKIIISKASSYSHKNATGLSIYFPNKNRYHYSYDNTVWGYDNEWRNFLLQYCFEKPADTINNNINGSNYDFENIY